MNKVKSIISFALILLSVSGCSCSSKSHITVDPVENKSNKTNNIGIQDSIPTAISFEQLKEFAIEPIDEDINCEMEFHDIDWDVNSFIEIRCLNSEVYLFKENENVNYTLRNVFSEENVATNVSGDAFYFPEDSDTKLGIVMSSTDFPIFVYAVALTSGYKITYANYYGETLKIEEIVSPEPFNFAGEFTYNAQHSFISKEDMAFVHISNLLQMKMHMIFR